MRGKPEEGFTRFRRLRASAGGGVDGGEILALMTELARVPVRRPSSGDPSFGGRGL